MEPWQWSLLVIGAMMTGLAKTGLPGLGVLVVTMYAWAASDVKLSAGLLLPLLSVADLFGVVAFRRHAQIRRLVELAPWMLAGMGLGALVLLLVDARWLRPVVGTIVLTMVAAQIARRSAALIPAERWHHAGRYGVIAGVATTVANAAGPVMNLYLLSRRLPKEEFLATGAWFFLVVNLAKWPIYAPQGMITGTTLLIDLMLAPAVVLGALIGPPIARRISQRIFENVALTLAGIGGVSLLI